MVLSVGGMGAKLGEGMGQIDFWPNDVRPNDFWANDIWPIDIVSFQMVKAAFR
jgi:hypothetical protein